MASPLLRPRMIAFHIACAGAVVAMVNLSLWQFDRLEQRREFNQRVEERSAGVVVDVTDLDLSSPSDVEWRRIGAVGRYRVEDEVLILNRSQGGRAGVNVVTPLQLDNGSSILVVRGFLPLEVPIPDPPSGTVTVVGIAKAADVRRATDLNVADGRVEEFFRLDIERIDEQTEGDVLPIALNAEASEPADDAALTPVARPELTEGPHLSYAIQWLIFSCAVVVGWVLACRKSLKSSQTASPAISADFRSRPSS